VKETGMQHNHDILIVDDDPDILDACRVILESNGYEVRTARNGSEAELALKKRRPDVLILDIMMATDTEGFDLAYRLREDPQFRDLPIILLTAFLEKVRSEGPGEFEYILGQEWPADWLFEKPVDGRKLIARIESVLASQ